MFTHRSRFTISNTISHQPMVNLMTITDNSIPRWLWLTHHRDIKLINATEGCLHGLPEGHDEADSSVWAFSTRKWLDVHCWLWLVTCVDLWWDHGRCVSGGRCVWWEVCEGLKCVCVWRGVASFQGCPTSSLWSLVCKCRGGRPGRIMWWRQVDIQGWCPRKEFKSLL